RCGAVDVDRRCETHSSRVAQPDRNVKLAWVEDRMPCGFHLVDLEIFSCLAGQCYVHAKRRSVDPSDWSVPGAELLDDDGADVIAGIRTHGDLDGERLVQRLTRCDPYRRMFERSPRTDVGGRVRDGRCTAVAKVHIREEEL